MSKTGVHAKPKEIPAPTPEDDTGIHITAGLKVYEAHRLAVRPDDLFVSFEDAPALIEALTGLLPAEPEPPPEIKHAEHKTHTHWES